MFSFFHIFGRGTNSCNSRNSVFLFVYYSGTKGNSMGFYLILPTMTANVGILSVSKYIYSDYELTNKGNDQSPGSADYWTHHSFQVSQNSIASLTTISPHMD